MFNQHKNIHLIGIGGIGMSALARIFLGRGCVLSGSDLKPSRITERLRQAGAKIYYGHSAGNIRNAGLVVYSAAVAQDNPELQAARALGISVIPRAQALARLADGQKIIAVTGAHGKTTTSSLIGHILLQCGINPTLCVGGELLTLDGNAHLGKGEYFVLEADESDGSFLAVTPFYSVVTNIDREHLDYYGNLTQLKISFGRFMLRTRDEGRIFYCSDDLLVREVVSSLPRDCFSFGLDKKAQIYAEDIEVEKTGSRFNCIYQNRNLGRLRLAVCGRHNICNALAAAAVGLELGLDFTALEQAMVSFRGVRRRMELKLDRGDIMIFEDYAHHPTEIKATLQALRRYNPKRLTVVFQPHRYTRTKLLMDEFGRCFNGADQLIITDIYPAGETAIEGINGETICQKAKEAQVNRVQFFHKEELLERLLAGIQDGDLVALLGAGDISDVADKLAEELKVKSAV